VQSVFETRPEEKRQFERVVGPIQAAALDFIKRFLSERAPRALGMVPPGIAIRSLARLMIEPTLSEARFLGSLAIAANFGDGAAMSRLLEINPVTNSSFWGPGTRSKQIVFG
jgi:hypothetical protein